MNGKKLWQLCDLIAAVLFVAADQYSKHLAVLHLRGGQALILIPGVLEFTYVENYGAAFGMFKNMRVFFVVTALIILLAVCLALYRMPCLRRYLPMHILLTLLAAGAAGNLIDRLRTVYVVDFIYVSLIDFPVFNVADICVTVSAVLLMLFLMLFYREDDFSFLRLFPEKAQKTAPSSAEKESDATDAGDAP